MSKFGDYTEDASPANDDLVLTKDTSATATKKVTLLNLIKALVSFVSSFTAASALDGSEVVAVSQGGNARKTTTQDIADLASGGGGSITINSTDGRLPYRSNSTTLANTNLSSDGTNTTIVSGQMRGPDGSNSAPTFANSNQTNSGMHFGGGGYYTIFSVNGTDFVAVTNGNYSSGVNFRPDGGIGWSTSNDLLAGIDTAVFRPLAGFIRPTDGTPTGAGGIEMKELAADPAAPGANIGRLYLKDNGSGKTQLVIRFNTGAVQVIATEP